METMSLNATVRTDFGKGEARKIRRTGSLPAVVYRGGEDALSLTIETAELETIFRKTRNRNTLVKLETSQGSKVCLVKDVQRHPVSQQIRHIDFFEVDESAEVEVTVKVVPVGTAAGTKQGGRLQVIRRDLKLVCKPADIPAQVEVDVTALEVGSMLRVSELEAPKGCKFIFVHDFNLVTVIGKRGDAADEAEEGAEGEAAAEAEAESKED